MLPARSRRGKWPTARFKTGERNVTQSVTRAHFRKHARDDAATECQCLRSLFGQYTRFAENLSRCVMKNSSTMSMSSLGNC